MDAKPDLPEIRANTPGEQQLLDIINAVVLRFGNRVVIADSYWLGAPRREVLIESKPGHIVITLGRTEDEARGAPASTIWTPEARA